MFYFVDVIVCTFDNRAATKYWSYRNLLRILVIYGGQLDVQSVCLSAYVSIMFFYFLLFIQILNERKCDMF